MKRWRILIILILSLILVGAVACNPLGTSSKGTTELAQVVKGNLTITVSGSGNIAVENNAKLTFGMNGKIDKIYVDEGDNVTKGQTIATLDTDTLNLALAQAQLAQVQSQGAITQAEIALASANYSLNQALEQYTWPTIKAAQDAVDDAEAYLDYIETSLSEATTLGGQQMWANALIYAKIRAATARATLNAYITNYDTEQVAIKRLQVDAAQQSLDLARQSLASTNQTITQAQKQLDMATLTAPFTGVVAKVNVDENDTVMATTPIVQIIDMNSLELKIQVDEIDIATVKLGQRAIIDVDALPDTTIEGKVSFISLLPTQQTGVVVYDVTISFVSSESIGLKTGMSATADIVIDQRNNVLLVPNRAINKDRQGETTVEVMVSDKAEQRTVATGISDGFQTEIVNGLSEGEMVVTRPTLTQSSTPGLFQ